jgi:uncharacterized membrane protein
LANDLDLVIVTVVAILALALVALDLPVALRLPIGLAMTLVLPGYAISLAFFPSGELRGVERAGLAFSLSLGVAVVGAPLLDALPWGMAPASLIAWVTIATLVATAAAWWRRRRFLAAVQAATDSSVPDLARPRVARRHLLAAGLGMLALSAVAFLANGFAPPQPMSTEFFIVAPNGPASSPQHVTAGVPTSIGLGITNRDSLSRQFRVVVQSGSMQLVAEGPITVEPGGTWIGSAEVALPVPGDDQVIRFFLYEGASAEVFRSLSLELDVIPA